MDTILLFIFALVAIGMLLGLWRNERNRFEDQISELEKQLIQTKQAQLPDSLRGAYDPRDIVKLDGYVDYVVFDGLHGEEGLREIVFLDVKPFRASMTPEQRQIAQAIGSGAVHYRNYILA